MTSLWQHFTRVNFTTSGTSQHQAVNSWYWSEFLMTGWRMPFLESTSCRLEKRRWNLETSSVVFHLCLHTGVIFEKWTKIMEVDINFDGLCWVELKFSYFYFIQWQRTLGWSQKSSTWGEGLIFVCFLIALFSLIEFFQSFIICEVILLHEILYLLFIA